MLKSKEKKESWLPFGGMEADLKSRRAVHPETGRPMKHAVSRHCDVGSDLKYPDGKSFGVGTLFPRDVCPGDITRMEKIVQGEWGRHLEGQETNITEVRDAGIGVMVELKFRRFGVKEIGAHVVSNKVASVFPLGRTKSRKG